MFSDDEGSDPFDAGHDDAEDEPIPGTEAVLKQRLKAAIMFTIDQIYEHEASAMNRRFDKAYVAVLAELVMEQVDLVATDLEAFANHAKRSTVQTEDVLLLARRAEPLKQHLAGLAETISANKQKRKKPVAKRNLSKD